MYAYPTPTPAEDLTPRAFRHPAAFLVDIKGPTTAPFRGCVRNVSASGMLLENAGSLRVGDVVTVALPAGEVICTVARLRGGGAGLRFVTTIDTDDLAWSWRQSA